MKLLIILFYANIELNKNYNCKCNLNKYCETCLKYNLFFLILKIPCYFIVIRCNYNIFRNIKHIMILLK